MLLTDQEIEEMVEIARDARMELFLSVGPRATYDTSASANTPEGARIGYRLRGYKNLLYALEDVKRACISWCQRNSCLRRGFTMGIWIKCATRENYPKKYTSRFQPIAAMATLHLQSFWKKQEQILSTLSVICRYQ